MSMRLGLERDRRRWIPQFPGELGKQPLVILIHLQLKVQNYIRSLREEWGTPKVIMIRVPGLQAASRGRAVSLISRLKSSIVSFDVELGLCARN